jgi:polysaccharide export outer membrane protein
MRHVRLAALGALGVAIVAVWLWQTGAGAAAPSASGWPNVVHRIAPAAEPIVLREASTSLTSDGRIQLCQFTGPVIRNGRSGERSPVDWPPAGSDYSVPFGQGAYLDPARTAHVPEYRLRVDDVLDIVFRVTREETGKPYELNVGDQIRIESLGDPKINRDLTVQPDGTITVLLLGQVKATRKTVQQLREELEDRYKKFLRQPEITVTPLQTDTRLRDIINTVDARLGFGGQRQQVRITPEGTIALAAVGTVPAQGLTIDEFKRELNARYAVVVDGLEVQPVLSQRAPRFIYVLGEVRVPGRYNMEGPTNVMQAISLAQGWNVGANLRQVVVFRRGADWQLMATMLDVWDGLYGNKTCPIDDIWLSDSDVVIVPKMKIKVLDEFIELTFTRGIYGVIPFQGVTVNMSKLSTL